MDAVFAVFVLMVIRLVIPVSLTLLVGTLIQRRMAGRIY
jgi:hypothetical protein